MKMNACKLSLALLAALALTACGGDKKSDPAPDTATPDTTQPDTVTPDTATPDVPCTPTCGLSECGDDGCGSVCGTCADGKVCADGSCVVDNTSPCGECPEGTVCGAGPLAPNACIGKDCGDVTFEGSCQDNMLLFCENDELYAVHCETNELKKTCDPDTSVGANCVCNPQCDGKAPCADDGCGGMCQTCSDDLTCNNDGLCVDPCGTCPEGTTCGFNPNKPNWCGSDTCGTVTFEGECQGDTVVFCEDGELSAINCKEVVNAEANAACGLNEIDGIYDCTCTPDCSGDPCGDDGCGGTCSACPEGQYCDEADQCCAPDCSSDPCGSDGCGGTCDACPTGQYCDSNAQCADFSAKKGNTCAVPITIDALPFEDAGDSTTQQDAYSTGTACSGADSAVGEGQPDVVYQYTPTDSGVHTVGLKDNQSGATIVTVTTDCATLDTACTAYSGDLYGGQTFEVTLTGGTTYFFIADGLYNLDVGGYVFTLTAGSSCTPACTDKDCGDDGCGSVCGSCADSQVCNTDGKCVDDVVPPIPGDGVDLSGYVLTQTSSDKSYTIPAGTIVPVGGTLVIGRKADKAAFSSFWGVSAATNMVYINAEDKFPSMNGGETYAVTDGGGVVWDGPSLVVGKYHNYQRTAANAAAGEEASWIATNIKDGTGTLAGVATPGTTGTAGPSNSPVVITEISDANGTGAFVYEFIELTVFAIQ